MAERSYSLAVLRFPGMNQEHPASSGWVIEHMRKWLTDPRISRVFHLRKSDTPITMVRNLLVQKALEENADYILMIDADMQPDVEPDGKPFWDTAWEFMMERREREEMARGMMPISEEDFFRLNPPATIAAPYCGPPADELPYVARWLQKEGNAAQHPRPYTLQLYDRDHASEFSGIFEVAALPTGLILYDARVFKRLPRPWFEYEWTDESRSQKGSTEDIFQTRNASLLGMPQFCAWDCWAGHIKTKVVRKPRSLNAVDVPNVLADAIRKGGRGGYKFTIMGSPEDVPGRPSQAGH
jgi:hypothetical protein